MDFFGSSGFCRDLGFTPSAAAEVVALVSSVWGRRRRMPVKGARVCFSLGVWVTVGARISLGIRVSTGIWVSHRLVKQTWWRWCRVSGGGGGACRLRGSRLPARTCRRVHSSHDREREFFMENPLVRIHFIIAMLWWTGLAPWDFAFTFPGSLASTLLGAAFHDRSCQLVSPPSPVQALDIVV